MGFACAELPEKQAEAADRKSDADQAQPRANPGQECPLGSEIHSWILLCAFVHSQIVMNGVAESLRIAAIDHTGQAVIWSYPRCVLEQGVTILELMGCHHRGRAVGICKGELPIRSR